jgi:hypothetical protein
VWPYINANAIPTFHLSVDFTDYADPIEISVKFTSFSELYLLGLI